MKPVYVFWGIVGLLFFSGSAASISVGLLTVGLFLFFWGGVILTTLLLYPLAKTSLHAPVKTRGFRLR